MTSYSNSRPVAFACVALLIVSIMYSIPGAQAWGNGGYSSNPQDPDYGSHDWIADMALLIQIRDVTFLSITYHSEYLLGTEAPDNPEYIGDQSYHHVYYHSDGTLQDDISAKRATAMYESSLIYLSQNNLESAAFTIGAMTHYIADVGVFGHTMGSSTDWGEEIHHSDYESAVESMIPNLDIPPDIPLGDKSAYQATIDLARDVTFGKGDIKPNIWMDSNYLWTNREFEASAMASLYATVEAVAAAINHLLIEAGFSTGDNNQPIPPTDTDEQPMPTPHNPQPPRLLNATLNERGILISWLPPLDDGGFPISSYLIYRSTDRIHFSQVAILNGNVLNWTDSEIQEGITYIYKMQARNFIGLSDFSVALMVTVPKSGGDSLEDISNGGDQSTVLQVAIPSAAVAICLGGLFFWRMRKAAR